MFGVLSTQLGVNIQPKFSAGNMIPDGPLDSFPSVSIITKAMQAVLDAGSNVVQGTATTQDAKNVGRALLPSSMQPEFDYQMNRGPNNELIGKDTGIRDLLTNEEWNKKRFLGWQGQALSESARAAVDRESRNTIDVQEKRRNKVIDGVARMMNVGELTPAGFDAQVKKYIENGGKPEELVSKIESKVSLLKQPGWFRMMRKKDLQPEATQDNLRILDNPYRK